MYPLTPYSMWKITRYVNWAVCYFSPRDRNQRKGTFQGMKDKTLEDFSKAPPALLGLFRSVPSVGGRAAQRKEPRKVEKAGHGDVPPGVGEQHSWEMQSYLQYCLSGKQEQRKYKVITSICMSQILGQL